MSDLEAEETQVPVRKPWITALRASSHSKSEQGFAIPVAVGMGLITILVATTMMLRSQDDQVTASAQKAAARSLGIAEGGTARTLSSLNKPENAYLLTLDYDPLNPSFNKTYLGPNQIQNDADGETNALNTWTTPPPTGGCSAANRTLPSTLLSDSIGSGNYQIKAYRYAPTTQVGALLIEGIQGDAVSRIQILVPVKQRPAANSFPGLYASSSIDLGNNDVLKVVGGTGANANIICRDCQVPASKLTSECSEGQPTEAGLNSAIGRKSGSIVDGKVYLEDPYVPPVPTPPTNTACSTSGVPCTINLGGSLVASTTSMLPRSADTSSHKVGTPYHYKLTDLDLGSNTLTINTTGDPVYIYASGNITLVGTGKIVHAGSPERLMIFGNPADPTNAIPDQSFTLSGGSTAMNAFIYAPDATVGVNGGSNDPDFQGAIWAKTWNASGSTKAEIRVPDNMNQLIASQLGTSFSDVGKQVNKTDPSTQWQRLEAR